MRELSHIEKLVFGADAKIDPETDEVIEQGSGAVTALELAAKRAAAAAHNAEFERLQDREKNLSAALTNAKKEHQKTADALKAAEDALADAVKRAEAAEAKAAELEAEAKAKPAPSPAPISTTGA